MNKEKKIKAYIIKRIFGEIKHFYVSLFSLNRSPVNFFGRSEILFGIGLDEFWALTITDVPYHLGLVMQMLMPITVQVQNQNNQSSRN